MKHVRFLFEFDRHPPVQRFLPIGDCHVGVRGSDVGHLRKYVDWVKKNGAYWFGMGDYCDLIAYNDPRFDARSCDMEIQDLFDLPKKQADLFCSIVEPIKDRCMFILSGNHEEAVTKHYNQDIAAYIATKLGVPYLGYSGLINVAWRWKSGKSSYITDRTWFVHHGWGGGRSYGGKLNKVINFIQGFDATDYFMGHVHDVTITKTSRLQFGSRTIGKPKQFRKNVAWQEHVAESIEHCFALTGSFLRSAEYAEKKGYNPSFVGAIKYEVDPFRWVGGKKAGKWRSIADVGTLTL